MTTVEPDPDEARAERFEQARARLAERGLLRTGPRPDGMAGILARPDVPGLAVTEGRRLDGTLGILARPRIPGSPVRIAAAAPTAPDRPARAPAPQARRPLTLGRAVALGGAALGVIVVAAALLVTAAGGGHAPDARSRRACARFDRLERAVASGTAGPDVVRDAIDGMNDDLRATPATALARAARSLAAAGGPADPRFPAAAAATSAACDSFGR